MTERATTFDKAKAKAFTQLMVRHFEGACVVLMIEVGRRVGLFDAMAGMEPASSAAIAHRAGLQERYVREWLGAMVTGGIVEYDPAAGTYALPREHTELVAGPSARNLSSMAAFIPLLSSVVPKVVEAFRHGGGVPYSAFADFTELQSERSRPRYDDFLFAKYLPAVDGLVERLEQGIRVADIGCGSGYCVRIMAKRFPRSTFVGFDLSEDALARARREAAALGLANASFVVADVARLAPDAPFDLVTAFDAIHDQVDPAGVLERIRAALAPGGVFLMLEVCASSRLEENVGVPMAPYLYTISTLHCMTVSLAHAGVGLGTAWGHEVATQMLREAGFTDVRLLQRIDPANSLYIASDRARG
jgi:SAM-dependent methyltransferase